MKTLRTAILMMLVAVPVQAQQISCPIPTPRLGTQQYPGARLIPTTNDLTQYTGKAVAAAGQRLMVSARLLDSGCVPIANAVVELWQLNPYGTMRIASKNDLATPNSLFSGAGRTYTDNNGRFLFTTLFPGPAKNAAPRLYLRVAAPNMPEFSTTLYFADDVRNEKDPAYKRLKEDGRRRVELVMSPLNGDANRGFVGSTDIVLPNRAPYRRY